MGKQPDGRPVIFGEVLFDCFPDGTIAMGGAPLNIAWHLQGFGLYPLLISRLGMDDYGQSVLDKMKVWGLDVSGIQSDPNHPTGRVDIKLKNGQPEFSILDHQAYDYIDGEAAEQAVASLYTALLYHGSLAVRNTISFQALQRLRNKFSNHIFVDINLRSPWWKRELIDDLAGGASWLKLNDVELSELSNNSGQEIDTLAKEYAKKYELEHLILTLGDKGARLFESNEVINGEPVAVSELIDTVGAGDAFSSVVILGVLHGWSAAATMPRALEFASLICSVRGATLSDRAQYRDLMKKWGAI